jgi:hypothetical protein
MEPTMKAYVALAYEAATYRILISVAQDCLRDNLVEGAKLALDAAKNVADRANAYANEEEAKEDGEKKRRVHPIFEPILAAIQLPPVPEVDMSRNLAANFDAVGRPAIADAESAD